jgi:Putative Ig domain
MSWNKRRNAGIGAMVALVAIAIAGCGGGDGGSESASQDSPPPGAGSNAAPTIQGTPISSVLAGQQYSFQPSASDPNGDALTFAVTNLPSWATFNASTGRVSGTPTGADVGTYSGITITVSDGSASVALAAFAISVTQVATGSATLSWTPPTQNSDGSTLTDLAGYQIRYGANAANLSQSVSVTNASLSTYVIDNLTPGIWYFAVAAVNSHGVSSALSTVASKTIG